MSKRPHNFFRLLLALLLCVQPLVPTAAYAEAQMRCVGMAASSSPCAHVLLPASGLNSSKAYTALMACCHMAKSGCTMHQGCPAMHGAPAAAAPRRATLSTPRCLVTIHAASVRHASLASQRARWLPAAAPTLAPPVASAPFNCLPPVTEARLRPHAAVLLPSLLPHLNGLRAPPVV